MNQGLKDRTLEVEGDREGLLERSGAVYGFQSTKRTVRLGFGIVLICLIVIGIAVYVGVGDVKEDADDVDRTEETIARLDSLKTDIDAIETSPNVFGMVGDDSYVIRSQEAATKIAADLGELRLMLKGDAVQTHRLAAFNALVEERLQDRQAALERRRKSGGEAEGQTKEDGNDEKIHERMLRSITEIKAQEDKNWDMRERRAEGSVASTRLIVILGTLFAFGVVASGLFFIERDFAGRAKAERALRLVNETLEERVHGRAAELEADVTAFKTTEERLRKALREADDLRTALNEHAIVAMTDPQGRITEVNDKFCEISKYAREELIGQDHRIINSGTHPKVFFRDLWKTIAQGEVWQGDIKNKAKDGSFYWVVTTIVPFLDATGKPRQYVAIRADITARKLAEEARARLSGIVRSSSDAIISKSLDSIITSWNSGAEKVFGYTEKEAVGMSMLLLFPPDRVHEETDLLARIAQGETVPHFDTQRVRKDGGLIDVSVTISPVHDSEGRVIGASKIARDITERRVAQDAIRKLNGQLEERVVERTAQLEAANKELEAFSYSVSHDLRAPLRAMDGFSQALLEDYGPLLPEEAQDHVQTIRAGAQKMGALIDDLLTFSRLSRSPLSRRSVNINQLVRSALEDLGPQPGDNEMNIRCQELPPCEGDPALLKQVWINLLSNAFKYTKKCPHPIVEIGSMEKEGETIYFVRDNGTGFDMRYAGKLFGVFQRLHRAEDYEGTGVGLAIVQRVVHRHGGRVWADAAVNQGAAFFFTVAKGELT